jgi:hypothetical protein
VTLSRKWPQGVSSMPVSPRGTPMLASADIAGVDGNIQAALDKTYAGGTCYGALTLGPGGKISLDSSTSSLVSRNSTTSTGGRFQCGHGDFPVLSPELTINHYFSFGEMFSDAQGSSAQTQVQWPYSPPSFKWSQVVDASLGWGMAGGSGASGTLPTAYSAALIPFTRTHDGGQAAAVSVSFVVSSLRTNLPSDGKYPGINVFQYDPFLNVTTSLTGQWIFLTAPANLAHYKSPTGSGNLPQTLVASLPFTPADVGQYLYFVAIIDESYAGNATTQAWNTFQAVTASVTASTLQFQ